MLTTPTQPTWRRLAGTMGPIVQTAAAVVVVTIVAQRSTVPFITPYLIVMFSFSAFDGVVRRHHPSVLEELTRPGIPLSDRLTFIGGGLLMTLHFVVGVADVGHFHWTGPLPAWQQTGGLVLMILAFLFAAWAMLLNPFFSPIVRVQKERGHRVITEGPYRIVRHPSYLGLSVGVIASGFALGSYWSLLPAVAFVLLYARRVWIEDQCLAAELEGFAEYSQKVPYRLFPLLW